MAPIPSKYRTMASMIKLGILPVLFVYIIASIIYLIKSKKSKKEKIIRLWIWLIIVVVICLILWYGSGYVLKNARRW